MTAKKTKASKLTTRNFPPLTEVEVRRCEKRLGLTLPARLRDYYLHEANGGPARPAVFSGSSACHAGSEWQARGDAANEYTSEADLEASELRYRDAPTEGADDASGASSALRDATSLDVDASRM